MANSKFKILKNGFTIIEILVTIAIILILVGGSYTGYATIADRQKLVTAGQNMKNILRDVQSRAYNREIDCTVCDCSLDAQDISHGWVVDFSNKVFYGNCYYTPPDPTPYTETAFNLGSDISLTVLALRCLRCLVRCTFLFLNNRISCLQEVPCYLG